VKEMYLASNSKARREFVLRIEDETVHAKTGRTWSEWRSTLDMLRAADSDFTATARHLRNEYELSTWWANTIAARYRWENGLT
jgi:hypothetical protein